jgi:hypothetical protein
MAVYAELVSRPDAGEREQDAGMLIRVTTTDPLVKLACAVCGHPAPPTLGGLESVGGLIRHIQAEHRGQPRLWVAR